METDTPEEIAEKETRFSKKSKLQPLTASLDRREYDPNLENSCDHFKTKASN